MNSYENESKLSRQEPAYTASWLRAAQLLVKINDLHVVTAFIIVSVPFEHKAVLSHLEATRARLRLVFKKHATEHKAAETILIVEQIT